MAIITKKALVSQIAKELQIEDREASSILNGLLGIIEDDLIHGHKVVLRGFGTFYVNVRKKYKKQGSYFRVYFKPHDSFLRRVQITNLRRHKIAQETYDRLCQSLVKQLGLKE